MPKLHLFRYQLPDLLHIRKFFRSNLFKLRLRILHPNKHNKSFLLILPPLLHNLHIINPMRHQRLHNRLSLEQHPSKLLLRHSKSIFHKHNKQSLNLLALLPLFLHKLQCSNSMLKLWHRIFCQFGRLFMQINHMRRWLSCRFRVVRWRWNIRRMRFQLQNSYGICLSCQLNRS